MYLRVFRNAAVKGLVLALSALLLYSPVLSQSPASGPQEQAPPVQWPRSHNYDVQHYRIQLAVDFPTKSNSGETTITFRPFANHLKEIELDAGEMDIKSVKIASGPELKYRYEHKEKLYVELDREYPVGTDVSVSIGYSTKPKRGLTFISPSPTDPNRPYQAWSQGEAQTNHYWFPCYDYPNDKASSETIVTADEKYIVISNGDLVGVQPDPAKKTKTWHWKMDRPFSSYLVSIIVGQYAEVKGRFKSIPVISYVYPCQADDGEVSFGRVPQMVAFFSEKIGVDYPYPKYAETLVRDFPGGMENISATTLTDTAIHDKREELDRPSDLLTSHELAHQWFGDLLTCRDWGQIWLNESFAEFFADLWDEHRLGEDEYQYDMLANRRQYFETWDRGQRRPVVTTRYSDPDSVFDTYAYPRGAATINMLRHVMGEEAFWKAIHFYVEKYSWQNVDTGELIDAIAESTGQNLQWFFDEWVYKMGHPIFDVTSSYDQASGSLKLAVKQSQKKDDKSPWYQSPDLFTMPVDVAITTTSGEHIEKVWIDKAEQDFTLKVDSKPLIVNFDRGDYVIKQLNFTRSVEELAYQAEHDSDVMGRIWALGRLKTEKGDQAEKALSYDALNDSFWGARLEAVRDLAGFTDTASRSTLLSALKDKSSRVRGEAVQHLAALKDKSLAPTFAELIKTDPSYLVVTRAAIGLGQTESPDAYPVLMSLMNQDS
ncbi:MAG TPA: M1 family aminopeptidase, partial [Blastocatellia bacterium]|nr:M1 family aminopeptidase [Blastocatellia bacterium]